MAPQRPRFPQGKGARITILAVIGALCAVVALTLVTTPARAPFAPQKHYSRTRGDGLAPKAPNPWFFLERAFPLGEIPLQRWHQAQLEARALREEAATRTETWEPRGPTNIGGRVTSMAVDPTDANIVYTAAA